LGITREKIRIAKRFFFIIQSQAVFRGECAEVELFPDAFFHIVKINSLLMKGWDIPGKNFM
jgi:hypothetical protein